MEKYSIFYYFDNSFVCRHCMVVDELSRVPIDQFELNEETLIYFQTASGDVLIFLLGQCLLF